MLKSAQLIGNDGNAESAQQGLKVAAIGYRRKRPYLGISPHVIAVLPEHGSTVMLRIKAD